MDDILANIGKTIGDIFANPVIQFGIRAILVYVGVVWLATSYWAFRDMQQRSDEPDRTRTSRRPGSSCSPRSSSCSPSGSTRSSGRTRRSARSGSGTWPRRRSWPRSRRSTTAQPATGGSTRSGSSARRAAPGSTASVRTAAGWSGSTGRCAPGAARTSSGGDRGRPRRSRHCRVGPRRHGPDRGTGAGSPAPCDRAAPGGPAERALAASTARTRCRSVDPSARRRRATTVRPADLASPPADPSTAASGSADLHHRGPRGAGAVRRRLAGDAHRLARSSWSRSMAGGRGVAVRPADPGPGRCCRSG